MASHRFIWGVRGGVGGVTLSVSYRAPAGDGTTNVWKAVREEGTHQPLVSLCSFIYLPITCQVCTMLQTLKQMPSLP